MSEPPVNPEDEAEFQAAQEKEHTRPAYTFKGKELAPYSRGTKTLYGMVCSSDNELVIYRALAFIYIHLHPRKEMIKACWGELNDFREKVLEFRETLTAKDEDAAVKLVNAIFQAEADSQVKGDPDDDKRDPKKKKGSNRASSPTSK